MNPLYTLIIDRAEGRCEYCHAPQSAFNFAFEVEHIQPSSAGGDDRLENIGLACRSCNAFKAALREAIDPESGDMTPLFHPRQDTWDEHFLVDVESLTIVGRTPVGRATVATLHLNSAAQLLARQQWQRLDLFP